MGNGRKPLRKQPCRLSVEWLEDRCLLSVFGSAARQWTHDSPANNADRQSEEFVVEHQRQMDGQGFSRDFESYIQWGRQASEAWRGDRWESEDAFKPVRYDASPYSDFKVVDEHSTEPTYSLPATPSALEGSSPFGSPSNRSDNGSFLNQPDGLTSSGASQQTLSLPNSGFVIYTSYSGVTPTIDIDLGISAPGMTSATYEVGPVSADALATAAVPLRLQRVYGPTSRDEMAAGAIPVLATSGSGPVQKIAELFSNLQDRRSLAATPPQLPSASTFMVTSRTGDSLPNQAEPRETLAPVVGSQVIAGQSPYFIAGLKNIENLHGSAAAEQQSSPGGMGPLLNPLPNAQLPQGREPELELKQAAPMLAGMLGDIIRVDAKALEQGVQQFLQDFDAARDQVVLQVAEASWASWLAPAVVASVAAMEITRRRLRRTSLELVAGTAQDTTWSWFPGASEPTTEGRS